MRSKVKKIFPRLILFLPIVPCLFDTHCFCCREGFQDLTALAAQAEYQESRVRFRKIISQNETGISRQNKTFIFLSLLIALLLLFKCQHSIKITAIYLTFQEFSTVATEQFYYRKKWEVNFFTIPKSDNGIHIFFLVLVIYLGLPGKYSVLHVSIISGTQSEYSTWEWGNGFPLVLLTAVSIFYFF